MLMPIKYQSICIPVNKFIGLTAHKAACSLPGMTLGERLKAARKYATLTQEQLSEKSGVSQQTISNIETGLQDKSTDIVQLAVACGVRPEWLAMEDGDMVDGLIVHDEKIKHLVQVCMDLAPYDVDRLVQAGDALKELGGRTGTDK